MGKAKSTRHLYKRPIVLLTAFVSGELIAAVFFIRPFRNLFPLPNAGHGPNATVGYAVYAGYPMYFDTIFFSLLIFLPVVFLIVLKVSNRYED